MSYNMQETKTCTIKEYIKPTRKKQANKNKIKYETQKHRTQMKGKRCSHSAAYPLQRDTEQGGG